MHVGLAIVMLLLRTRGLVMLLLRTRIAVASVHVCTHHGHTRMLYMRRTYVGLG